MGSRDGLRQEAVQEASRQGVYSSMRVLRLYGGVVGFAKGEPSGVLCTRGSSDPLFLAGIEVIERVVKTEFRFVRK